MKSYPVFVAADSATDCRGFHIKNLGSLPDAHSDRGGEHVADRPQIIMLRDAWTVTDDLF
ncbi:hypothetical protein APZ00_15745 [Pannonibacter phragmitetus]|uniref:Uncharacterized protein n=1 Tax=Pannonibacter phragmitetus TaxID=121719 RepID=A0A0U3E9W2_9HYPH|nr:hypothetical protein APZ00_15745 [Pannonibacter phragmitetus]